MAEKICRHCKASIPATAGACPECGRSQTRGGKVAIVVVLVLATLIAGAIYGRLHEPGTQAALDDEARAIFRAASERRDKYLKASAFQRPPELRNVRLAKDRFEGQTAYCAERVEPEQGYDRVIIAHDVPQYDSAEQGPWFGHLWVKLGCWP